jgi:Holliday junction DNA helicase RuvA
MIDSVRGIVSHVDQDSLVLEISGVGIRIEVPATVLVSSPGIGKAMFVYTRLIVREDSLQLFGFINEEERTLFNTLLKISGIGPRLAISILSSLSPEILQTAILNDQPEVLVQVPGIGKKTAERIIFHLKDKLDHPAEGVKILSDIDSEVLGALNALGYNMVEAQAALRSIPPEVEDDVEVRLRQALRYFSNS